MSTQPVDDEEIRRRATRLVDAKLGFRAHLLVYVLVNAGLAAINLMTTPTHLWFIYPMGGWGIGLLAHGLAVHQGASDLRERMIAEELERQRRRAADGR